MSEAVGVACSASLRLAGALKSAAAVNQKETDAGSFSRMIPKQKFGKIFEKDLALDGETSMVFLPFKKKSSGNGKTDCEGDFGELVRSSVSETFSEVLRKDIDGLKIEVFVDSLSLIGKLFEIYFVRLIGTPNQNSKSSPT